MAQGVQIGRGFIAVEVDEKGARAALKGFVGFAGNAFAAAATATGVLVGAAAKVGIQFNAMKEQASVAFTTLLGDGQKAQAFLQDLQQFAAKTPFEMPGLIDNARQLLGVGVAAEEVIPTMTALGNAAGALGLNQDAFNRIMLATTQAMGKGKLQGEELLQMVEAGIPVWQLLSEATGKTVPELQKLSEQGKLLAADTLPLLFDQMNQNYGGAMAAQADTLVGKWSSLKDNTRILLGTAFKPLFDETKNVTGALGELAASDKAEHWARSVATGMTHALDATKIFAKNVKAEFGPAVRGALDDAGDRFEDLWPTIKEGSKDALSSLTRIAAAGVPALVEIAQAAGGVVGPALDALAGVFDAIERNSDELAEGFGNVADAVSAVAGPAFAALGAVLQVVGGLLQGAVSIVTALSGPLGTLTGVVLAGVLAWKAYSTVAGLATGAFKAFNPATIQGALTKFGSKIDDVALSAGVMTERLTGSANAGQRVADTGGRVSSAMGKAAPAISKVGSALPFVGIAAAGVGLAFEQIEQQTQGAVDAMLKGGDAAAQLEATFRKMEALAQGSDNPAFAMQALNNARQESIGLMNQQLNSMTEVERAQTLLTQAQNNYDDAVRKYGPSSAQAVNAQSLLVSRTQELEQAQRNAANAARDHQQSLYDLASQALGAANADLQLRQSQLGVTQAQQAYTEAVAQYGAESQEAAAASLNFEQAVLRSAEAARQKALADNAGKSEADQAKAANQAYTQELLRLAVAAGENAPPALLSLIGHMSDAELQARNAAAETSAFGYKVITLPDGRTLKIAVDDQGSPVVLNFRSAWDQIKDKAVTLSANFVGGVGTVLKNWLGFKAEGGSIGANKPYVVGEEGPELITPSRSGWVHTADETAKLIGGGGGAGGTGINLTQNITPPPSMDTNVLADVIVDKIEWRVT